MEDRLDLSIGGEIGELEDREAAKVVSVADAADVVVDSVVDGADGVVVMAVNAESAAHAEVALRVEVGKKTKQLSR